jgi:putative transposase
MAEKARQQKMFSREDTPTEQRVLGAFLSHVGLSYRKIKPFVGCCHEAIRDWFHRCKHLFEPDCRERHEVAVDETKIDADSQTLSIWAAVDCDTLEVLRVDVSPGRSSLDALLSLKEVLTRCRGHPLVWADRGPWYDWPLELFDCDAERETWKIPHLLRYGSACSHTEPDASGPDFRIEAPPTPPDQG